MHWIVDTLLRQRPCAAPMCSFSLVCDINHRIVIPVIDIP